MQEGQASRIRAPTPRSPQSQPPHALGPVSDLGTDQAAPGRARARLEGEGQQTRVRALADKFTSAFLLCLLPHQSPGREHGLCRVKPYQGRESL